MPTKKKKTTPSVRSLQKTIRDLERKVSSMYTQQDLNYKINRTTKPLEKELQECRKERNIAEKDIANQR
jgi:TolA-binding protein